MTPQRPACARRCGPSFTDDVATAIEATGPYRCRPQISGLHNDGVEINEEEVAPEQRAREGV